MTPSRIILSYLGSLFFSLAAIKSGALLMEPSNAPALVFKEAKRPMQKLRHVYCCKNLNSFFDQTQVRSNRPPFCARLHFVRSFSRSFVFVLLSLAFRSFAFTLVRFGYAHFAVARFSLVRFHAPSLVLPSLCPLCCAFRCSFICLFVSFFSAITPRPCL